MRLMTFRYAGQDHAGVLTPSGLLPILEINSKHDLHLPNSLLEIIQNDIRDIPVHGVRPIPLRDVEPRLPYNVPPKIWCIGLNYKDHTEESKIPPPERPVVFAKFSSCITAPGAPIVLPPDTKQVNYEAELAVVIGRRCRGVSAKDALDYVAGYTCLNDVGARDFLGSDGQVVWAKSQDTFGPMGPCLVTREDIRDPQRLPIRCWVNGQLLQDSNTDKMIFGVRELIVYISRGVTLEPGDVISTGTPPPVGSARKQPVFLKAGDEVVVEVEGIGRLSNPVKAS